MTRNKKEMWLLLIVKLEMTVYIGTFQAFIVKSLTGTVIPQGATIAANLSLCLLWKYKFCSLFFCKVNLEFCINKYFK